MKFWIFKCDPDRYRIVDRLADPNTTISWTVNQHADEIHNGDIVFLWATGSDRGIRAVLRLDTDPQPMFELDSEQPYWSEKDTQERLRVIGSFTHRNVNLSADRLRNIAGLENLSMFHGYQQMTNFPVSPEEGEILLGLASETSTASPKEPRKFDLKSIATELNARGQTHAIGKLQEIRAELRQLSRQPGKDIFRLEGTSKTVFQDWAFHYGGRTELQFNIGIETDSGVEVFRHGIAFSFETSQALPTIDALAQKVPLFNEYLRLWPDQYADMRLWHFRSGKRSDRSMPGAIAPELVTNGRFVFLGKWQAGPQIDFDRVLDDMDRLLPLYKYVESSGKLPPISNPTISAFSFHPGCSTKPHSTVASHASGQLDVTLRHNLLQKALHDRLAEEFGSENVGTEIPTGAGTSIDLVLRRLDGCYWFYEIKTFHSPRACIREALGQLLEYAHWPGCQQATRFIVVGEGAIDDDGNKYLNSLREQYGLPIAYEQVIVV